MDKYRGASVRHTFSHGVIERLVNRVERQVAVEITIATIDRFDIGHAGAEEVEMGSGLVGRLTMRDYAIRMVVDPERWRLGAFTGMPEVGNKREVHCP